MISGEYLGLIPVSEYLNTTYRPDRDYIDGEVKEAVPVFASALQYVSTDMSTAYC